ncbi:sporulation protein YpjB [Bacillus massilinigeriensis]|uniref:sporulation protein YpjB n=1 Tax=Bacillus massilionigeriensis TaxID=1805475 RepID=UPI00096AE771|nr:sporulation protein YpjB [Bacillus massilionigeriensis]
MRAKYAIFALIILLLIPLSAEAETTSPIEKLDRISDESLQMVKSERYEDAQKLLQYFSNQFETIKGEHSLTMDELRMVTFFYDEALEATTGVDMMKEERIKKVTKFRLIMDALNSEYQPMWAEMEDSIMQTVGEVRKAAKKKDIETFHSELNSFLSQYELIYPSIKLDIEAERIQKLEARINYIDHYRSQVIESSTSQKELELLESDLHQIFTQVSEDDADPSLWWVMISTGSIIIVTLTYVGWKKYRGQREKARNRSRGQKD